MSIIDTGEILAVEIVETEILPLPEATRNLTEYARQLPPTSFLRRPDATGEIPVYVPSTIGIVDEYIPTPGSPPPPHPTPVPPPAPRPSWVGRVGEFPTVRPAVPRPAKAGRGRHRRPAPAWALLLIGSGSTLVVVAAFVLALLVVTW